MEIKINKFNNQLSKRKLTGKVSLSFYLYDKGKTNYKNYI